MPPQHANTALLRELDDSNFFFDSFVDVFPAKLYVAGNTGDEVYNPKYFKGQHKESKESRRARNKASKRAKFDPEQAETTTQAKERKDAEDDSDSDDEDDDNVEDEEDENENESTNHVKDKVEPSHTSATIDNEKIDKHTAPDPLSNVSRIEALRAKLQAKIAEKRAQRPQANSNDTASAVSKRAARRAEKQKRQEDAKKRKAAATAVKNGTKTKLKVGGSSNSNGSTSMSAQEDLQHLDFGKLAGLNAKTSKSLYSGKGGNNKSLSNVNKKQSLEKMLADAESKKQKLLELKQSSTAEDKSKYQKMQWGDTLKEADGERVKDDPSKLRKAIKQKAAKKTKSQKAWKSRTDQTQEKQDSRQKIRSHNLDKRMLGGATGASLSKKKIVEEKDEKASRRLSRAGFEGKKTEFLNKKGGGKGSSSKGGSNQ